MDDIRRKIIYQADTDPTFAEEIAGMSRGETLRACIQCGNCSGACPVSPYMDHTPRQIIAMTRAGFKKEALSSTTIWLCASCYNCTVECPKGIRITDVMYALKQKAIKERLYPKRFPMAVLAREFSAAVRQFGRNSELWLIIYLYLKTNPFAMLGQSILGLRLFLQGRMGLKRERIPMGTGKKGDLQVMMNALDRAER
jgi:heterodisulfide reductase subunit C